MHSHFLILEKSSKSPIPDTNGVNCNARNAKSTTTPSKNESEENSDQKPSEISQELVLEVASTADDIPVQCESEGNSIANSGKLVTATT